MEMISISKEELEKMKERIRELENLEKIDFDLVKQFLKSKEDLASGRFRRLA